MTLHITNLTGPHLSQLDMEDGSPALEILAPNDDDLHLGPQQLRIYGRENLIALAKFCALIVRLTDQSAGEDMLTDFERDVDTDDDLT